ncbi:MAG: GntR family transcriptional regulator [Geminicoccaceae bacterium]|nr:GntR family transcriptional regulator [Geminicoccaceae bacterium]
MSDRLGSVKLVADRPMVAQVFDVLRARIVAVDFLPGERLSEKEISAALGVSKTPVREALIRLEEAGAVEIVPRSGTYVTPIRIDRYIEACFVRLNLEIGAVRRAAGAATHQAIARQLDAVILEQRAALAAGDYIAFFDLDQRMHRCVFELSGIGGVWTTISQTQAEVDRVRHLKRIHNISRGEEVLREHAAIVDAIRAGDPAAAEKALVRHLGSLEAESDGLRRHPVLLDFIDTLNARLSGRGGRTNGADAQKENGTCQG